MSKANRKNSSSSQSDDLDDDQPPLVIEEKSDSSSSDSSSSSDDDSSDAVETGNYMIWIFNDVPCQIGSFRKGGITESIDTRFGEGGDNRVKRKPEFLNTNSRFRSFDRTNG